MRLSDELGLAIVLITHDLPIVAQTCQTAAVMYAGRIAELGPTVALHDAPRHPYTRMLFAATPDLAGTTGVASIPGAPPRLDVPLVACPFAPRCDSTFAKCRELRPPLLPVGAEHQAACHLAGVGRMSAAAAAAGARPRRALPAPARPRGRARAPRGARRARGRRHLADRGRGRARRARRRVGLRQDDDRPGGHAHARAALGLGGDRRTGHRAALGARAAADPPRGADRVPGSVRVARPALPRARHGGRAARDPPHRLARASARERVREALERAGLSPAELFLDRYPHELSGGQRQRVAIAAALVLEPKLLVADEPVSMLDVSVRAGILDLLDGLRKGGLGILMITHDLSTATQYADRIMVMYLGRIVEEGPAREVVANPQHPYTRALISVVPRRDPHDRRQPADPPGRDPEPGRHPRRLPLPSALPDRRQCLQIRRSPPRTTPAATAPRASSSEPGARRLAAAVAPRTATVRSAAAVRARDRRAQPPRPLARLLGRLAGPRPGRDRARPRAALGGRGRRRRARDARRGRGRVDRQPRRPLGRRARAQPRPLRPRSSRPLHDVLPRRPARHRPRRASMPRCS